MRAGVRVTTVMAAVVLASGCGSSGDGGDGCYMSASAFCQDLSSSQLDDQLREEERVDCEDRGGEWRACPSAGRAGTCDGRREGSKMRFVFYKGLVCTQDEGRDYCEQLLSWADEVVYTPGTVSCGEPTEHSLACDARASDRECVTATGPMPPERLALLESSCGATGTLVDSCPSGELARCTVPVLGMNVVTGYYAGADLRDAEEGCAGTWELARD